MMPFIKILTLPFFIIIQVVSFAIEDSKPVVNVAEKHLITAGLTCKGEKFSSFKTTRPDGSKFSNKDFKNKIVFVTFWQQSSPFCIGELEEFNEMFARLKDSKPFIFVAFTPDSDSTIKRISDKYNIGYNFIHLGIKIAKG